MSAEDIVDGLAIIQQKRGRIVDQGDVEMLALAIKELRKGRPGDDAFRELCVAALRVVDDGDFLTALENHCAEHGIDRDGYPLDSDTGERIGLPVGPNWPMIREQLT